MKAVITLMVLLGASVSMAATCQTGEVTAYDCKSTPKAGDEVVAGDAFDSVAVCVNGKKTSLAFEKNNEQESAEVKVDVMAGGTMYTLEDSDVTITLNVTTGTAKKKTVPAKLTTIWNIDSGLTATSTYTCKR